MAKVAFSLERAMFEKNLNGWRGQTAARVLARGTDWTVEEVVCTCGRDDHSSDEHHANVCIAVVAAGSFSYRSLGIRQLMTPGSLLLGNYGHSYECSHQYSIGDLCVAFTYSPDYFDRLSSDATGAKGGTKFSIDRLPPLRSLAPLVSRCHSGVTGETVMPWEELSIGFAARTVCAAAGISSTAVQISRFATAKIAEAVRLIEDNRAEPLSIEHLAGELKMSRFHFLRTFRQIVGITPHQYVLRLRLRTAAMLLRQEPSSVLKISLDSGFGDLSNFNRMFHGEFGLSPREYRRSRS